MRRRSSSTPRAARASPRARCSRTARSRLANGSWAGPVMGARPPRTRVLAVLPLAHSFGLNGALLAPLLAGARRVPDGALRARRRARRHRPPRVTVLPAVATMFRRLLDSPALPGRGSLEPCASRVSGAAPCPWELAEEWRRRTGVRLLRGYGMTELFRPISYLDGRSARRAGRHRPARARRRAVPRRRRRDQCWARTRSASSGSESPAASMATSGAPEATRAVLADGWFRTGDLATHSPEGFVKIVGRKKDLILRGGYSVVPGEVEAVLLAHPAVAEAAVVGVPHATLGEEIAAFVTLRPGTARGARRPDRPLPRAAGRLQVSPPREHRARAAEEPDGQDPEVAPHRLAGCQERVGEAQRFTPACRSSATTSA